MLYNYVQTNDRWRQIKKTTIENSCKVVVFELSILVFRQI